MGSFTTTDEAESVTAHEVINNNRTGISQVDDVEVVHVIDGQVQRPDPNEVTRYDTEGNKKKNSCKDDA